MIELSKCFSRLADISRLPLRGLDRNNNIFIDSRRHVVHAEVEKVRISAPIGHEGRVGREAFLHVPLKPEEQSAKVQARLAVR